MHENSNYMHMCKLKPHSPKMTQAMQHCWRWHTPFAEPVRETHLYVVTLVEAVCFIRLNHGTVESIVGEGVHQLLVCGAQVFPKDAFTQQLLMQSTSFF